jgi:hypothetical protein
MGSRGSVASGSSLGSSGGGSAEGSGENVRKRKKKGRNYKKDNIFTRIRDMIAESDVFVERNYTPPHVTCVYITLYAIPVFLLLLIWDTLAVTAFEVPRHSMIDHPGFVVVDKIKWPCGHSSCPENY